jgi:hypothetical protein
MPGGDPAGGQEDTGKYDYLPGKLETAIQTVPKQTEPVARDLGGNSRNSDELKATKAENRAKKKKETGMKHIRNGTTWPLD